MEARLDALRVLVQAALGQVVVVSPDLGGVDLWAGSSIRSRMVPRSTAGSRRSGVSARPWRTSPTLACSRARSTALPRTPSWSSVHARRDGWLGGSLLRCGRGGTPRVDGGSPMVRAPTSSCSTGPAVPQPRWHGASCSTSSSRRFRPQSGRPGSRSTTTPPAHDRRRASSSLSTPIRPGRPGAGTWLRRCSPTRSRWPGCEPWSWTSSRSPRPTSSCPRSTSARASTTIRPSPPPCAGGSTGAGAGRRR